MFLGVFVSFVCLCSNSHHATAYLPMVIPDEADNESFCHEKGVAGGRA